MVGVTGFEPAASTSQTSRATNCATPRCVKNIEFLRFFRKWSNLWSNHFYRDFYKRVECRKSQCLQGFSALLIFIWGRLGVLLPNVARYQLRHTPKCEKYSIFRSFSVSGQTCGQTVFIEDFAREYSAEIVSVYKGFRRFLFSRRVWSVSCSQTSRASCCD